jgi:mRNA interferase RelE/StbE
LTFSVLVEKKAVRQIDKLAPDMQRRILGALGELEKGFSARLDIKKLKGTRNHYRIRVGDYRILFALVPNMVYVYDVSHRENAYE